MKCQNWLLLIFVFYYASFIIHFVIMRLLALDIGQKRTGIAVTDPLQILCQPLDYVPTHTLMAWLQAYFLKEAVVAIIIGMPMQPSGEASSNTPLVIGWVRKLRKTFADKEVVEHDEKYTTIMAHRVILQSGISKIARQEKGLADKVSAALILQSYLERRELGQNRNQI